MIRYNGRRRSSQNPKIGKVPQQNQPPKQENCCWNIAAKIGKHLVLAEHAALIREQLVDKHHRSWQEEGSEKAKWWWWVSSPSSMWRKQHCGSAGWCFRSVDRRVNSKPQLSPCEWLHLLERESTFLIRWPKKRQIDLTKMQRSK